jgi:NADH dehydrogenase/NADH:ubiquinone oxidoreductase subunit G
MCIDICPVGALTSGIYRYQTRPWEMEHVGTICTHCSNGCKTTLGVRNGEIIRGNNRDRSGINGEFLCIKGRYGFDFHDHPDRLQTPLLRVGGKLEPVSWSKAIAAVASKLLATRERGGKIGVVGSITPLTKKTTTCESSRAGSRTNHRSPSHGRYRLARQRADALALRFYDERRCWSLR